MKKTIFLLFVLMLLFVPVVVKADFVPKIRVECDKETLNVGEVALCKVIATGDVEENNSIAKHGVNKVTLKVVLGSKTLSFVDKYGSASGWYLNGKFEGNVNNYTLTISDINKTTRELFDFKVMAQSMGTTVKTTVKLEDIVLSLSTGDVSQTSSENAEITVNADPNATSNDSKVPNPGTGDNMLYLAVVGGLIILSLGYVSYKKLKLK